MPINYESPPLQIGKIGPYTVFVTPPATPSAGQKPKSSPVLVAGESPVQVPSPPSVAVMAPPAQFYNEKSSSPGFFWDTVAKIQNGILH